MSSFLAALAVSQLLWGWSSDRWGESLTIKIGTYLLLLSGVGCALASSVEWLTGMRALQGLAAGAATVAVPSLIRKRFNEIDSVKAVSTIASIEALVPAIGPVLGAVLISIASWRTSFWLLSVLILLLIPSAPQIIVSWFQLEVYYFSVMQVAGVAALDSFLVRVLHGLGLARAFHHDKSTFFIRRYGGIGVFLPFGPIAVQVNTSQYVSLLSLTLTKRTQAVARGLLLLQLPRRFSHHIEEVTQ